jgi:hypothetical protein
MLTMLFIALLIIMVWFVSAMSHEYDLHRNFKKTGNAQAWFFEIKKDDRN